MLKGSGFSDILERTGIYPGICPGIKRLGDLELQENLLTGHHQDLYFKIIYTRQGLTGMHFTRIHRIYFSRKDHLMKCKGINYDIGTRTLAGGLTRPVFDIGIVAREIEIIKSELHCNAIGESATGYRQNCACI